MNTLNRKIRGALSAVIKRKTKPLAVGLCTLAGMFGARADVLTWDPGLNGNSGGAGTWNLSTANWWNGTADVTWKDTSAIGTNGAIFSGASGGAITLNTSLSAS